MFLPSGANSPKSHKVGYESQFASVLACDYVHLCTAYTAYSRNYAVQGNATFTARAFDSSKCLPNWLRAFKIRQFLEPVAVSKYRTLVPFFFSFNMVSSTKLLPSSSSQGPLHALQPFGASHEVAPSL